MPFVVESDWILFGSVFVLKVFCTFSVLWAALVSGPFLGCRANSFSRGRVCSGNGRGFRRAFGGERFFGLEQFGNYKSTFFTV